MGAEREWWEDLCAHPSTGPVASHLRLVIHLLPRSFGKVSSSCIWRVKCFCVVAESVRTLGIVGTILPARCALARSMNPQ